MEEAAEHAKEANLISQEALDLSKAAKAESASATKIAWAGIIFACLAAAGTIAQAVAALMPKQ
jgi:hypothetical protein